MPTIPIAQSRREWGSIPESSVTASPDAFGYQEARVNYEGAMRQIGQLGQLQAAQTAGINNTIRGVANLIGDQLKKDAQLDAETKLGEFELGLKSDLADFDVKGDGSYQAETLKRFDEGSKQVQESAGLFQGEYYERGLARLRLRFQEDAIGKEVAARKAVRLDNADKLAGVAEVKVYQNPGSLDSIIAETTASLEGSGLTTSQKAEKIAGVRENLTKLAIDAHLLSGDVASAEAVLASGEAVEALGGIEALRARASIEKAKIDIAEKAESVRLAQEMSNGTAVLDPEDAKTRKLVDKAWTVAGGNGQLLSGDPNAAHVLAGWVQNYGVVPSSALSRLNAMSKNGSDEQKAYAFQVVNQLEAARPGVIDNSGAKTGLQKDAAKFRYYIEDMGLAEDEAIRRIEEQRKPEFKLKEDARRTDAGKLSGKLTVAELADAYDISMWSTPAVGGDPRRADVVLNVFREAFEEHYIETGDEDQARALAVKDLKRTYNQTQVSGDPLTGGNGRIMKYPPELYYAPVNGSHEWIKEQLVADVKAATGKDIDPDKIFIEANRATAEAIAAAPSGQIARPVYAVIYQDENGTYQTIAGKLFKPDENAVKAKATGEASAESMERREGLVDEQEPSAKVEQAEARRAAMQERIDRAMEIARKLGQPEASDNPAANISMKLETGEVAPLEKVSQVVKDTGGTKSYGNFGINSGGSMQDFVRTYGEQFGLTAKPGSKEFDAQWRNAAGASPVELHAAEMQWHEENVTKGIVSKLEKAGVPDDLASDARVQAYFADRVVQQGPGSISGSRKHRARIKAAAEAAEGDAVEFLKLMTQADRAAVDVDFKRALKQGNYSKRANENRTGGRLKMSLLAGGNPQIEDKAQSIIDLFGFSAIASVN